MPYRKALSLDLVMPAGMTLAQVRRNSCTDVVPIESGTSVSIPLLRASQGVKLFAITIDYVARASCGLQSERMRPVLPVV